MPVGHVLGLSDSDIAPRLFMDAGNSIVDSIRRSGDEVDKMVQTSMTNRQLKFMGQELQTLDPVAPNYLPALMGVASKYPLAASSETGQRIFSAATMAANQNFQREMDARNFNQQGAHGLQQHRWRMDEQRQKAPARSVFQDKSGRLFNGQTGEIIAEPFQGIQKLNEGQRIWDPSNPEVFASPENPRTTATPFRFGSGVRGNAATGEITPLPELPGSQAKAQLNAARIAASALRNQAAQIQRDTDGLIRELSKETDEGRKSAIQRRIDDNRRMLDGFTNSLQGAPTEEPDPLDDTGPVPEVLPPPNALPSPSPLQRYRRTP